MKKTLIFDLDGTLLNTLEDLRDCTNFALNKFGFPHRNIEEIRTFAGNGLRNLMKRSCPEGTPEEKIDAVLAEMKNRYCAHAYDKTVPYRGIIPMLQELKKDGASMAIVSNKANDMIQILHQKFFSSYIPVAIGETDGLPRKPAPDLVDLALRRLNVTKENAYYIGDSEVDILTAKNAGLPCLVVGWGFRDEKDLLAAGAEKIYVSPAVLLKKIRDD